MQLPSKTLFLQNYLKLIPKVILPFMNRNMRIGVARPVWHLACLCLLLAGMLSLQSCKKEYFETDRIKDATWNPELAVPLIKSTITVPEVLGRFDDQDVIVVDTTGILALRYFGRIFSVSAENVIVVQNQSNTQSYPLSTSDALVLAGGGTVNVGPITYDMALDMSNFTSVPEIHSITFKGGSLDLAIATAFTYPTTVTISIPGLTQGSTSFSQTVAAGSNFSLPLAGWTLDLTQGSQGFNDIRITASGSISGSSGIGVVGQQLDMTVAVNSPAFSLLLGDVKQQTFGAPASEVRIRFFENQQDGDIFWADPRVKAIFNNGVGADVRLDIAQMDFANQAGQISPLTSPVLVSPVIGHNPTVGVTQSTILDLNRSNSNIITVAGTEPTKLFYEVGALTNPGGGANLNWLQDTSKIGLDMEVFLPFDGTATDFAKTDTAEVQIFPIDGDIQEIESVTFRLTIDNGFPADAHAQVYFYDSTLVDSNFVGTPVPIDSMFPTARAVVFASAIPDGTGHVNQNNKVRTTLDITLDRDMLNKLEANKFTQLMSRGWIDTYDAGSQNVQIFEDYEMDLYLGVIVKIKYRVGL
jgi:hypothetical protein